MTDEPHVVEGPLRELLDELAVMASHMGETFIVNEEKVRSFAEAVRQSRARFSEQQRHMDAGIAG